MRTIKLFCMALVVLISCQVTADPISEKAAEKLLDVMDMKVSLEQSIEQMLDLQLQQNPGMAPYRQIMGDFFKKHMSYASLKPDMIKIYSEAFTAKELNELTAFYSTPVGKKTVEKMPGLMAAGGQLGSARVQAHLPELQKMIQDESERLQQQ